MSICNNGDSNGRWDMDDDPAKPNGKNHKQVKEASAPKLRTYEVIHRLMIEADSHVDAAYGSLVMVQQGEQHALTYEVKLGKGRKVVVDLATNPPTVI